MADRYKLIPEVYLILERGEQVLLLRRFQTGYEDGRYGLVAGHLEAGESAVAGIIREAREEAGMVLREQDLRLVHTVHRNVGEGRMGLFFRCRRWSGEPVNAEPHKCDDLSWFSYDRLPENVIPYIGQALTLARAGKAYSDVGWDQTSPV
ncbi:NUDIX domain-containing protein [Emcibacter sp. SYSU 3D8]|uniref:NUDIX hydrolase n=1 Tax=Emcibacter sp. SYSU 3D8 TaxID=3133969 RepID=UPI0031FE45AF